MSPTTLARLELARDAIAALVILVALAFAMWVLDARPVDEPSPKLVEISSVTK